MKKNQGFTIVELLVVIVVIGILAAITMISFGNIQRRARIASIQAELKSASNLISVDYVNGEDTYPEDIGDINNGRGLNIPGYTLMYTTANGYCLSAVSQSDSSLKYRVSSDTSGSVEEGGCEKTWKQISSAGASHSCGIATDNLAYCWGYNYAGEVGDGTKIQRNTPVAVDRSGVLGGLTIKFVDTGYRHACAIASDDNVYCWGDNTYGQLGNNSVVASSSPVQVSKAGLLNGKTIKSLSVGFYYTCAIASDDQAYCWGYNWHGQLGIGSQDTGGSHTTPSAVVTTNIPSGYKSFKTISSGYYHVCAIAFDDHAYCWGSYAYGGVGSGATDRFIPYPVDTSGVLSGKIIKSISTGYYHTCTIDSNGIGYCWGGNDNGEIGDNSTSQRNAPVSLFMSGVLSGKTLKNVSAGMYHTCAIASDDQGYCWGNSSGGELGNGNTPPGDKLTPVAVSTSGVLGGKTIKSMSVENIGHTCVIASDRQAYCWGGGSGGQLGDGLATVSSIPVHVQPAP